MGKALSLQELGQECSCMIAIAKFIQFISKEGQFPLLLRCVVIGWSPLEEAPPYQWLESFPFKT